MDKKRNYKLGIICIICSAFCFALMNLFIRLSGDVPTMQKCFFRNFFAFVISAIALLKSGTKLKIGQGNLRYLVGRAVAGCVGMICNFYAVDHMAISDAAILNKLSPFFALIISIFLLKEIPNLFEWSTIFVVFFGALFVVKPSFSFETIPAIAGVIGGLGAGTAYAFVRKLGIRGENSMIIVAFFSAFTTLMLAPNLIFNYAAMEPMQWFYLVLTGTAAAGGQIFITKAYSYAPAKEISVYDFSIVLFTAILGFTFLGQVPDIWSVIGYIIIIGTSVVKWYYTVKKQD